MKIKTTQLGTEWIIEISEEDYNELKKAYEVTKNDIG